MKYKIGSKAYYIGNFYLNFLSKNSVVTIKSYPPRNSEYYCQIEELPENFMIRIEDLELVLECPEYMKNEI